MQPLVDGDILLHELGWSGQFKDKDSGEDILLSAEHVIDLLDAKIAGICEDVDATEPPIIYITSSEKISQMYRRWGNDHKHEEGFRYSVATTQPYKGNRNNPKPFHFYNIVAYLMSAYNTVVSTGGLEADDMMVIEQKKRPEETVICSRDKDLRICEGWHFSWECGGQRAIGPHYTDRVGSLNMKIVEKTDSKGKVKKEKKVTGYGQKFFYYQMLVGDSADYIPGLRGWGLAKAFEYLEPINSEYELFKAVQKAYITTLESTDISPKEFFFEQANLLWMREEPTTPYHPPKKEK